MKCAFWILLLAVAAGQDKKPPKTKLLKLLEKIEAGTLDVWTQENSHLAEPGETVAKKFKVVRGGGPEYTDTLPESGDGVDKLYRVKFEGTVRYNDGSVKDLFHWYRLYWNPKDKNWVPTHPNQSAFNLEQAQVGEFLYQTTYAVDMNACFRMGVFISEYKSDPKGTDDEKRQAEFKELTKKLGEPWGGTELLEQVYDLQIKIERAGIEEKIELAKKRRGLLRQIVDKAPK